MTMTTWLLLFWLVLSLPAGIAVGRFLRGTLGGNDAGPGD